LSGKRTKDNHFKKGGGHRRILSGIRKDKRRGGPESIIWGHVKAKMKEKGDKAF